VRITRDEITTTPCDRCELPISLDDGAVFCSCQGIMHPGCWLLHKQENPQHEEIP
jgi:hypothetical protein